MRVGSIVKVAFFTAMVQLCVTSAADATERNSTADHIANLEHRYSQTFVTGDVRTADRMLANTFVGFGSNGKATDKAAMLAVVRSEPHQTSAKITSLTVRLHGNTAVAFGTEEDTSPRSQNIAHRMWLDTWKLTAEGWKMVASGEIVPGHYRSGP